MSKLTSTIAFAVAKQIEKDALAKVASTGPFAGMIMPALVGNMMTDLVASLKITKKTDDEIRIFLTGLIEACLKDGNELVADFIKSQSIVPEVKE